MIPTIDTISLNRLNRLTKIAGEKHHFLSKGCINLDLSALVIIPAFENTRSIGALVAGKQKFVIISLASDGNRSELFSSILKDHYKNLLLVQ